MQWKAAVSELKTNIKKKARDLFLARNATGGGILPPHIKDLTPIEETFYNTVIKPVSVEGAKEVVEVGLNSIETIPIENIFIENVPQEIQQESEVILELPPPKRRRTNYKQTALTNCTDLLIESNNK
ncbi:hypothetical protein FQR65_LT15808 [Abscondita terminalis]|nr:hypothetical protein FQR65_LT15808 [Abscondita terminalis]